MFTCDCNDDTEPADIFKQDQVVARKSHRCCECGDTIQPGRSYERITMLADGHWYHYATCGICAQIAAATQSCGRVPGVLWEDIHEANCFQGSGDSFCLCPTSRNP
jgi:hypothetical protein